MKDISKTVKKIAIDILGAEANEVTNEVAFIKEDKFEKQARECAEYEEDGTFTVRPQCLLNDISAILERYYGRLDKTNTYLVKLLSESQARETKLVEALKIEKRQRENLTSVLNQPNHKVIGWHLNGDNEPVSSFFDDNDEGAAEKTDQALKEMGR